MPHWRGVAGNRGEINSCAGDGVWVEIGWTSVFRARDCGRGSGVFGLCGGSGGLSRRWMAKGCLWRGRRRYLGAGRGVWGARRLRWDLVWRWVMGRFDIPANRAARVDFAPEPGLLAGGLR